jgi:Cys-tRNA(Pro)/Cys-tRNA(Cys) deacylase
MQKTNAMRALDRAHIDYTPHSYAGTGAVSGTEVAQALGFEPEKVFKTLVTEGKSGAHYVFIIPSNRELDLRKAAEAAKEKSVAMIRAKDLLPLTGYVHGGCSPIGMKKQFITFLDESARQRDTIVISAGKIGYQIELRPEDLMKSVPLALVDVAEEV